MRKRDDRGETGGKYGKKETKIMMKIVATNGVANQPPNGDPLQRRPLVPIMFAQNAGISTLKSWSTRLGYTLIEKQLR